MSSKMTIERDGIIYLFSYNEMVAWFDKSRGEFIRTDKKWSNTTSKHIGQFRNQFNPDYELVLSQLTFDGKRKELFGDMSISIG